MSALCWGPCRLERCSPCIASLHYAVRVHDYMRLVRDLEDWAADHQAAYQLPPPDSTCGACCHLPAVPGHGGGISTVAYIVNQVTRVIWDALVQEYMPHLDILKSYSSAPTIDDWRSIAEGFRERWAFPNCLGSIDGKHVVIRAPDNSGSLYDNYKGTYSIVLLAVVDSQYCFPVVDVGSYGRTSDGGVLANSIFGQTLWDGTFGMRRDLMRPFPGTHLYGSRRAFNFRLFHARLIVENTFGILTSQWRMYRGVIVVSPSNVDACVKATCILHNLIRRTTRPTTTVKLLAYSVLPEQAATRPHRRPSVSGRRMSPTSAMRELLTWQPGV
ncbi:putative nuclease HARBI1 [Merluccius polli]|uniref:Nuclease HARBI1 n=1 Tax=Merluccius polli TaxID=89951 RepID=A0AA47NVE7_MERPO|nr:putative nuclease HARBI1 [Merluccius polli]